MSSLNHRSLLSRAAHLGSDIVHDVVYLTHPLVHAVEQPVANIYTEAKTVVTGAWNASHAVIHLAAYWFVGTMAWDFLGAYFPREKRMITGAVDRVFKRPRLQ